MQGNIETSPRKEIDLGEINKGVELLMRRHTSLPIENLTRRKHMEAALITIGVFTGILTLTVGFLVGFRVTCRISCHLYDFVSLVGFCGKPYL